MPASVPEDADSQAIEACIRSAGERTDWLTVTEGEGGHVIQERREDRHVVRVDVHYDPQRIRIEYRDSENLSYDPDGVTNKLNEGGPSTKYFGPVIHRSYAAWVEELLTHITRELDITRANCT